MAITKSDLATEEQLSATRELLRDLAPETRIVEASPNALVDLIDTPNVSSVGAIAVSDTHPLARSLKSFEESPSYEELQRYLASLDADVIRVKGVVQIDDATCVLVQKTGPHLSLTQTPIPPTGLVLLRTN